MRKIWMSILIVLAALGLATSTAHANNVTVAGQPTVVSSSATDTLMGVLTVKTKYDHVGTYINIPKSKIKSKTKMVKGKNGKKTKKKQLDCFTAYGKWINSMYKDGDKFVTYEETSRAKWCKLAKPIYKGGRWWHYVKVAGGKSGKPCYNLASPPHVKKKPKPTITGSVMDYSRLQYELEYQLKGMSTVSATATCIMASSWASATAYGYGYFATTVRVRVSSKSKASAKGEGSISLDARQSAKVNAEGAAMLDLNAKATASCSGPDSKVVICPTGSKWNGSACAKDGTTTPPPPADAPGPNPNPSPDDPTKTPQNPTGSWKCYDEVTGQPVNPLPDGRCPQGSYGGNGV